MFNLRTNTKVFARIRLTHVLLCKKKFESVETNKRYSITYDVNDYRFLETENKTEKRIPMGFAIFPSF